MYDILVVAINYKIINNCDLCTVHFRRNYEHTFTVSNNYRPDNQNHSLSAFEANKNFPFIIPQKTTVPVFSS